MFFRRKKDRAFFESLRLDEQQRRALGAWDDVTVPCDRPSPGWHCNLQIGHDGPCPAWPNSARSL
jgi:hypothetical protein